MISAASSTLENVRPFAEKARAERPAPNRKRLSRFVASPIDMRVLQTPLKTVPTPGVVEMQIPPKPLRVVAAIRAFHFPAMVFSYWF